MGDILSYLADREQVTIKGKDMTREYDNLAIFLYQRWFGSRRNFIPFSKVSRKEQDYWRGLAQISYEAKGLNPPEATIA